MSYRDLQWTCTKCHWVGKYNDAYHVMYHGIDWEQCPICKSIAIPECGSTKITKE